MSFEHWIAFAAASAVLLAIPGPTVLLIVSYSLEHGRRAASATVVGVALGDFTAMTASMLGLGALLAASATLFTILKWVGAVYLVYLGIKLWSATVAATSEDRRAAVRAEARTYRIFMHTYAVTTLNPKGIVFFVAFLPQFLDLARPIVFQMIIFETTFLFLATLNAAAYGLLASLAGRKLQKPRMQRLVNRVGGSLMIAAGLLAVSWKKAAAG